MKRLVLFVAAMALAVAGMAYAQATPDFSGTWVLDPAKSDQMGGGGGGGRGPAGPMTIKHEGSQLSVTRGENTTTYKLDGSETAITGRMQGKATAKVDAGKLVIKSTFETPNGTMEQTATYTLGADGKELTVVTASTRGERKAVYTKQ